jgi:hypothetical protein
VFALEQREGLVLPVRARKRADGGERRFLHELLAAHRRREVVRRSTLSSSASRTSASARSESISASASSSLAIVRARVHSPAA